MLPFKPPLWGQKLSLLVQACLAMFMLLVGCGQSDGGAPTATPVEFTEVMTAETSTAEPTIPTNTPANAPTPAAATPQPSPAEPEPTTVPTSPPASPTLVSADAAGMIELNNVDDFKAIFNEHEGEQRLILFLANGCPSCLAGARWLEQSILTQDADLEVTVFAIWFGTVPSSMLPSELRGRRDETLLNDPRVIHFWDGGRDVNQFFATNVELVGPERSALNRLYGGVTWGNYIWDVYLLYSAESLWSAAPDQLVSSGYPILNTREALSAALNPNVPVATNDITVPTTYEILPAESVVSYGVGETFAGNTFNYAIGVTSEIQGEMLIDPNNPSASQVGPITIAIVTFQSDNFLRDELIQKEFLESATYPLAVFTPTELRGLPTSYSPGETLTFEMAGELNVRETPVPTTFQVEARLENGRLIGIATTQILMTDFGFDPPAIAGFLQTENEADITLEFVAVPVE